MAVAKGNCAQPVQMTTSTHLQGAMAAIFQPYSVWPEKRPSIHTDAFLVGCDNLELYHHNVACYMSDIITINMIT